MADTDPTRPPHDAAALARVLSRKPRSPDDVPLAKSASGLWVPAHLLTPPKQSGHGRDADAMEEKRPAIFSFTATTYSWSEAFGTKASFEEVLDRLRCYSVYEVVSMVARITIALDLRPEDLPPPPPDVPDSPRFRVQYLIAERLANEGVARWLVDRVRATRGAAFDAERIFFFQERQVLNALKLALIVTDVDRPDTGERTLPFVEALLMLSDHLDPEEGSFGEGAAARPGLELYFAANSLFNEHHHRLHDYVRAHTLYVTPWPELAGQNAVDLPAALERATGMDAETTWHALYALYLGWGVKSLADLDSGDIVNRRSGYLQTLTRLDPAMRERWFELSTWDAATLQERVRRDYSAADPRWFDVLPFEERPLVAFGDVLFCVSLPLLAWLPGRSIQHRFLDDEVFTKKERRRFLDTRGAIVERYTIDSLRRAFGSRLVTEADLQDAVGEESVCDAIIVYPDAVILFECKTFSVLIDTRHATNYDRFRAKWAEALQKAATQFESTLRLIRAGAFVELGVLPDMAREVYPVVGVFEQPVTPLTYRTIREQDLADHPFEARMRSGDVHHLQLLRIGEVELWEAAAERGYNVLELLREKTSEIEMVEMPFRHFAILREKPFIEGHTSWHAEQWDKLGDDVRDRMREWGLSEAGDESSPDEHEP